MVTSWPTAMAPPSQSRGSALPPNQAGSPVSWGRMAPGSPPRCGSSSACMPPRPDGPLSAGGPMRGCAVRCTRWVRCWMLAPRTAAAPSATRAGHRRQQRDRRPPRRRGARPGRPGQRRPQAGARVLPGLKQRPLPADPVGSSCAWALATSVGRGSLACGLWMRYHAVGAATLAPPSGLHGLITLQNWWSGAGSNRRPSAFQEALPGQAGPEQYA